MQENSNKNMPQETLSLVGDFEGINIAVKKELENDAKEISAV